MKQLMIILSLFLLVSSDFINISMPGALPTKNDDYICTRIPLHDFEDRLGYVTQFKAIVNESVHHIILSGCNQWMKGRKASTPGSCDVQCNTQILFTWAHNGAPLTLPKDVSYAIGKGAEIKSLNMEVHYMHSLTAPDFAMIQMKYTWKPTHFKAGVILLYSDVAPIPARAEHFVTNISCRISTPVPIYVVGIRMHSHGLNKGVLGFYQHYGEKYLHRLAKGTAQWPQTFYHPSQLGADSDFVKLEDKDLLMARCIMDASQRDRITEIGSTNDDEMCNLYLMYIIDSNYDLPVDSEMCADDAVVGAWDDPPPGSFDYITGDPPAPINSPEHMQSISFHRQPEFRLQDFQLGQTSGVALTEVDGKTQLFIIHRGENVWDEESFSEDNIYQAIPVAYVESPILHVEPESGAILKRFGDGLLVLPHGLSVELAVDGSPKGLWLTDVALHQVMRFDWNRWHEPSLVLGRKLQPGNDHESFCQPTDVAVASTGEIFIGDGYCNQRIVKFSSSGEYMDEWNLEGKQAEGKRHHRTSRSSARGFQVVHSITIIPPTSSPTGEGVEQVCAADRERAQIDCYDLEGYLIARYAGRDLKPSVFAIAYSSAYKLLFGVTGVDDSGVDLNPFEVKMNTWFDRISVDLVPQQMGAHAFAFEPLQVTSDLDKSIGVSTKLIDIGETILDIESPTDAGLSLPHDVDISPDGSYMFISELKAPFLTKIHIIKSKSATKSAIAVGETWQHFYASPETIAGKLFVTGLMVVLCVIVVVIVLLLVRSRKNEPWAFKSRGRFWPTNLTTNMRRQRRYDKDGFRPLNQDELNEEGYNSEDDLENENEDQIVDIRNFSAMSSLQQRPLKPSVTQNGSTASNVHIDT